MTERVVCSLPQSAEREIKGQYEPTNAHINASLSHLQLCILKIITNNPKASYEEIATKTGKDRSTIRRNVQYLKEKNILHRTGSKKTGFWEIVK